MSTFSDYYGIQEIKIQNVPTTAAVVVTNDDPTQSLLIRRIFGYSAEDFKLMDAASGGNDLLFSKGVNQVEIPGLEIQVDPGQSIYIISTSGMADSDAELVLQWSILRNSPQSYSQ